MLKPTDPNAQQKPTGLLAELNPEHKLIALANQLDWQHLENTLSQYYSKTMGAPAKPIRLMSGILMLKQLYNLSDEAIIDQYQMNPYYQYFCGNEHWSNQRPCDPSELTKFRNRIGEKGIQEIFLSASNSTVTKAKNKPLS